MEPERKIEKLLRAFAGKRRDDAGGPLSLHPATRRLLQGEVSRRTAKPAPGRFRGWLFGGFRPAFLYAASVLAVVAIGAFALLRRGEREQVMTLTLNDQHQETVRRTDQIGLAPAESGESLKAEPRQFENAPDLAKSSREEGRPPASVPPSQPAGPSVARQSQQSRAIAETPAVDLDGVQPSGGDRRLAPGEGNAAASAKDSSLTVAQTDAAASGGQPARGLRSELESRGADRDSFASSNLNLSGGAETSGAVGEASAFTPVLAAATPTSVVSQRYHRPDAQTFGSPAVGVSNVSVLAAFQLERSSGQIRIVDKDGSVYSGTVQPEPATTAVFTRVVRSAPAMSGTLAEAEARAAESAKETQPFAFRVTGTNRSLGQNVVFTGRVISGGGAPTNEAAAVTTASEIEWGDSRVIGTAVLEDLREVEIQAMPASP